MARKEETREEVCEKQQIYNCREGKKTGLQGKMDPEIVVSWSRENKEMQEILRKTNK